MAWRPIESDDDGTRWWRTGKHSKFLCDENLGDEMVPALRELGYNAIDVWDVGLHGKDDRDVLQYAWKKKRILLTHELPR